MTFKKHGTTQSIAGPITAASLLVAAYLVALGSNRAAERWIPAEAKIEYAVHPYPLHQAAAQNFPIPGGMLNRHAAIPAANSKHR